MRSWRRNDPILAGGVGCRRRDGGISTGTSDTPRRFCLGLPNLNGKVRHETDTRRSHRCGPGGHLRRRHPGERPPGGGSGGRVRPASGPYGLVRYGVAPPDHPRIKEIVKALRRVLSRDGIRFLGNVHYGTDVKLSDLRRFYDAVIFSTGARADRRLDIPGVDLPGSYGAADFVSWYDGHPDVPREWPLTAKNVAVLGGGQRRTRHRRVLAKPADEQLATEIPGNVYRGLALNQATDVHVFARRGPAQIKFTPMEFRELSHSPSVDVVVHPEGFEIDEASQAAIGKSKSTKLVVDTLMRYLEKEPTGAPHRIHIHLCQAPVAILGTDRVEGGLRTERTELIGDGTVRGDWRIRRHSGGGGVPCGRLSVLASGRPALRPRSRCGAPPRQGSGARHGRRHDGGHLRDRVDQAGGTDRPHRPHEVRRGRDRDEPVGRPAGNRAPPRSPIPTQSSPT